MWDKHLNGQKIGLITGKKPFDPALPSILLVHGSGGYKELYRQQITGLSGRANAAAIDLPGHGDTPGPGLTEVSDYAAWLARFLAAGPVRPVVLGHSLGGAVALQTALDHPELLSGLILMGSGARLRVMPQFLAGLAENYQATIQGGLSFSYADGADPTLVAEGIKNMLNTPAELVFGDFSACDRFDVMDRVAGVTLPTMALVGDQDRLTPLKYSQHLATVMPNCRVKVIAGAGHMTNLERPGEVTEAIAEFLAGIRPAAG